MRAFSLIETLIYLALFTLIMGEIIPVVANIRAAAARIETQTLLLQEGTFLLETIASAEATGSSVSSFHLSGSVLMQDLVAISGNQVIVSALSLRKTSATSIEPGYVDISFALTAHTDTGTLLTHVFNELVYIDLP